LLSDIQQDAVQKNDRLVQLGLEVEQIHHMVVEDRDDDDENLYKCQIKGELHGLW
jgi:hypothetical protein